MKQIYWHNPFYWFFFLCLPLFLKSQTNRLDSTEILHVSTYNDQVSIVPYLSYYIDLSKKVTVEEILAGYLKRIKNEKRKLSFGPQIANHWLHFKIKNDTNKAFPAVINFEYAHVAEYTLYRILGDSIINLGTQGDRFPFEDRKIKHPHFLSFDQIAPQEIADYYIRINQEGQDLPILLTFSDQYEFFSEDHNTRLLHGFSFGLILLNLIGIFGLYITFKKKYFLLQFIASLFSMFYVLAEEGYGYMYLWGFSPTLNGVSRPLSLGIVVIFSLLFTINFLKIKPHAIIYHLIIAYSLYLIIAHPLFLAPIKTDQTIGPLISIFLYATLVLAITNIGLCLQTAIKKKSTDAFFLLSVFSLLMLAILIRTLSFQGGITNLFTKHTGIITLTIQTTLIAAYLFYRTNSIIRENQKIKLTLAEERQQATDSILQSLHQERERISMNIHDSLASLLSAAKINLETLKDSFVDLAENKEFSTANTLLTKVSNEMALVAQNLMPKTLKVFGLIDEIQKHINLLEGNTDIQINLEYHGFEHRLPEKIELELYYITMEVLDNALKYSNARTILVQLMKYDTELVVIYEDDGIGFDINAIREGANGLANIRNRTTLLYGETDIHSRHNDGTTITLNIPL